MALAFSSDGVGLIERKLEGNFIHHSNSTVVDRYHLEYCVKWILSKGFKRPALQFPDEFLSDAVEVEKWLQDNTNDLQLFILADTSYGSCCVDEVAAEHYKADCVIHFGESCLSPTKRLPVLYLFNKRPVDVTDCVQKIKDFLPGTSTKIGILYDVSYYHVTKQIHERISKDYTRCIMSELHVEDNAYLPTCCTCNYACTCCHNSQKEGYTKDICVQCGCRTFTVSEKELEDYNLYYIGSEGLALTNLMMNWNKCLFYSYNPESKCFRKETLNVNKALMKRYYLVEKIKDAQIVGILVGTLGVANYLQVMSRVKELLKKVGKKYYTFVVGKLNVAKLANFMEIDIYVYVSCPENSLVDSSEFYRPIVTPFEVELACNPDRHWTGEYVTDFQQLLPGGGSFIAFSENPIEETTDVSLVHGGVRKLGITNISDNETSTAITERSRHMQVALSGVDTAGDYLKSREWQGLEQHLGKTPVTKAVEGRRGIAIAYEEEPEEVMKGKI